jgi:hypothetical protein
LPPLKIPDRHRPGVDVLASLSSEQFSELLNALKRAPSLSSSQELIAWVTPEVKSVPAEDVKSLVTTLTSLYALRVRAGVSPQQLATDVFEALRNDNDVKAEQEQEFASKLATLLTVETLSVIATKAQELRSEFEHTFCDARILTDLRPVFGGNVEDTPTAMIIVHTLKLGYHDTDSAEHKELFIAIDEEDIAKLAEHLIRATKKEKTLKARLEVAGIKFVGLS